MTRKERALKNLKQMCSDGRYLGSGSYAPLEVLEDFKVAIKAIEQEPRKGHWIDKFGGVYRCSCCREIISIDTEIEFPNGITYKYCPYCGSDNREVEE